MIPFRKLIFTLPRQKVRLFGTSQAMFHKESFSDYFGQDNLGLGNFHQTCSASTVERVQCLTSFEDARVALGDAFDYSWQGTSFQGIQGDHHDLVDIRYVQTKDDHIFEMKMDSKVGDFGCQINLNFPGCVHSNALKPQNTEHCRSLFSYPSSGFLPQKLNKAVSDIHPSRKYHTTSVKNGHSATKSAKPEFGESPSPQGIQGDDCTLELWMQNCMRYNLPNCDEQLKNIKTGRKTLSQVLEEQDLMIRQIAESYKAVQSKNAYASLNLKQVDPDTPSPQGIQGDDCVRFQLWLENCQRFGLSECQEQLNGIKSGRKTLAQVFAEQDASIRDIVRNHYQKRNYSTTSDQKAPEVGRELKTPNPEKLSQKDRLKRAVKEYGSTVIIFHVGISLISLGGFYLAVSSGIDMVALLKKIGLAESLSQSKITTGASTFVVAYAVHKVFAPVRIGITLTSVPLIVRYLRRIGFLKPPTTSN